MSDTNKPGRVIRNRNDQPTAGFAEAEQSGVVRLQLPEPTTTTVFLPKFGVEVRVRRARSGDIIRAQKELRAGSTDQEQALKVLEYCILDKGFGLTSDFLSKCEAEWIQPLFDAMGSSEEEEDFYSK